MVSKLPNLIFYGGENEAGIHFQNPIHFDKQQSMPNKIIPIPDRDQAMIYQIRIKGHLGEQWADWFEDLSITLQDNGDTLLTGPVVDQAALHGLLKKVCDLGLPLLSVDCIEPGKTNVSDAAQ